VRHFITILILFAFFAQSFSKSFIVLDYYSNTAAYEKKCVNKARPKMKCHGRCQMILKLQEEEKKEQQCPGNKVELKAEVLSSKSFFATVHRPVQVEILTLNFLIYTPGKSIDRSLDIFHPPQA
jgi:hypothetical protein